MTCQVAPHRAGGGGGGGGGGGEGGVEGVEGWGVRRGVWVMAGGGWASDGLPDGGFPGEALLRSRWGRVRRR